MSVALGCLLLGLAALGTPDVGAARERLAAGDYAGALLALEDASDGVERAQVRAAVLEEARDFLGGLAHLRGARVRFPDDVELAMRETRVLLWLQSGAPALAAVGAFERNLAASAGSAEWRAPREAEAARYRESAVQLVARAESLATAEGRSRGVALGCLLVAAGALAYLARSMSVTAD